MDADSLIAVFAQKPAQAAYLADIVRLTGAQAKMIDGPCPEAALILSTSRTARSFLSESQWLVLLDKEDIEEEGVRVVVAPAHAAELALILTRMLTLHGALPPILEIGGHRIDTRENLWLRAEEAPVRLTEKELAILALLKARAPATVSRQEMLEKVWDYVDGVETHTLETHIYRLRQKIETDPGNPQILLTAEDGYRLGL